MIKLINGFHNAHFNTVWSIQTEIILLIMIVYSVLYKLSFVNHSFKLDLLLFFASGVNLFYLMAYLTV